MSIHLYISFIYPSVLIISIACSIFRKWIFHRMFKCHLSFWSNSQNFYFGSLHKCHPLFALVKDVSSVVQVGMTQQIVVLTVRRGGKRQLINNLSISNKFPSYFRLEVHSEREKKMRKVFGVYIQVSFHTWEKKGRIKGKAKVTRNVVLLNVFHSLPLSLSLSPSFFVQIMYAMVGSREAVTRKGRETTSPSLARKERRKRINSLFFRREMYFRKCILEEQLSRRSPVSW